MKNDVKCYRCGHIIDVNSKKLSEQVTCPHCQGKMDLDKKTRIKYTVLRYIFIVIISFAFVTLIFLVTKSTAMIVALTILLAFGLSTISSNVGLWLTYKLFGLKYEHKEVDKKSKKK